MQVFVLSFTAGTSNSGLSAWLVNALLLSNLSSWNSICRPILNSGSPCLNLQTAFWKQSCSFELVFNCDYFRLDSIVKYKRKWILCLNCSVIIAECSTFLVVNWIYDSTFWGYIWWSRKMTINLNKISAGACTTRVSNIKLGAGSAEPRAWFHWKFPVLTLLSLKK